MRTSVTRQVSHVGVEVWQERHGTPTDTCHPRQPASHAETSIALPRPAAPRCGGRPPRRPAVTHADGANWRPLRPTLRSCDDVPAEILGPSGEFGHREHIRLAWRELREHDRDVALRRVEDTIRHVAAAHGAPDKYHRTITEAWVALVHHHLEEAPALGFDEFVERFPGLLDSGLLNATTAASSSPRPPPARARSRPTCARCPRLLDGLQVDSRSLTAGGHRMHRHSLHEVRPDAFNYVWDNAIEPVLEVDSGAEVEFHVRDAGDEQIGRDSTVDAVTNLDFSHVNPVSGPVAVKGAQPGRRARGRDPRAAPRRLGLDGDHPRVRAAGRRVPRPVAAHLAGRRRDAPGALRRGDHAPVRAVPGHDRGGACRSRASTRSCRRRPGAATSTSSTCAPARRCTCRSASRARSSRSATRTPRWATARCAARPSRRRWTSSFG